MSSTLSIQLLNGSFLLNISDNRLTKRIILDKFLICKDNEVIAYHKSKHYNLFDESRENTDQIDYGVSVWPLLYPHVLILKYSSTTRMV